jgi:hypothetical protein
VRGDEVPAFIVKTPAEIAAQQAAKRARAEAKTAKRARAEAKTAEHARAEAKAAALAGAQAGKREQQKAKRP